MPTLRRWVACAAAAVVPAVAGAQGVGSVAANASVQTVCTITANPLAFGVYDPLAATPLQQTTSVSIACTQGAVASIALGGGLHALGIQRRMRGAGGAFLAYNLYQPATAAAGAPCAFTTPWGGGGPQGAALVTLPAADLNPRSYNVCGHIPPGQNAPVATYTDVVIASVTF